MKRAIAEGDERKTLELLANKFDVNCKDENGVTPLHDAAQHKHEHLAKILLEHKALPQAKTNDGNTTLHFLCKLPEIPLTESLIDLFLQDRPPLDVSNKIGTTPLMFAAKYGEEQLAMKLILHGANIRAVDSDELSVLHYIAFKGKNPEMITQFVKEGMPVDARDCWKSTTLHCAAQYCLSSADTAECLLKAGADSNARNCDNRTPLHIAALHGNILTVKMLLEHGANPHARDHGRLIGDKPRSRLKSDLSPDIRNQISEVLKEAEQAWKRSGKKK